MYCCYINYLVIVIIFLITNIKPELFNIVETFFYSFKCHKLIIIQKTIKEIIEISFGHLENTQTNKKYKQRRL
jgi:hypothetical protein